MTAHRLTLTAPHPPTRPRLVAVPTPQRPRPPLSGGIALFAAGMAPGFLLAAAVSVQSSPAIVHAELLAAAGATVIAMAAAARARQIQRRREHRLCQRNERRPAAPARALRRVA